MKIMGKAAVALLVSGLVLALFASAAEAGSTGVEGERTSRAGETKSFSGTVTSR